MTNLPPPATWGYIRWHSKLTRREGGCNYPIANPAEKVAQLNSSKPTLEHWYIPVSVTLPSPSQWTSPTPQTK